MRMFETNVKNATIQNRMNERIVSLGESGIREFCKLAVEKEDCINLTIGEPDFETSESISKTAWKALKGGFTHYPPNNGYLFLREAVSEYEKRMNGYDYSPDEIIITAGATEALYIALGSLIEEGDEVVIPVPAFGLYEGIVKSFGGVCRFADTTDREFQLCADTLESVITEKTKAVIINSPNNPTGAVCSEENLKEIAELLKSRQIFVICDDVYQRIFFGENGENGGFGVCRSIAGFEELRDRVVAVQSFSKTYAMTGWRAGYLMADLPVARVMAKLHRNLIVSVPSFVQFGCVEALNEIHDREVAEMTAVYKRRRDLVCGRLQGMGIDVVMPKGGFYAFPKLERFGNIGKLEKLGFRSSEVICRELIENAAVALTPGSFFGCDGYARLSFCYPDWVLEEGMDRLERYAARLKV